MRNEDGSFEIPEGWPFPRLNFENEELRKYMLSNVAYLVNEFGADGFRCDMGDYVPIDFWAEAFKSVKRRKPDLITLNEGQEADSIKDVFDCCYGRPGQDDCSFRKTVVNIFTGKKPATELINFYNANISEYGEKDLVVYPEESIKIVEKINSLGGNAKLTLYQDNEHDSWTDTYSNPEVFKWMLNCEKKYNQKNNSENMNNSKAYG